LWLTEGFDTLDLKEAKALVDELPTQRIPGRYEGQGMSPIGTSRHPPRRMVMSEIAGRTDIARRRARE
jgi:hypothetical protein